MTREPWLGVFLSLVPGAGQIYAGRTVLGIALGASALVCISGAFYFICSPAANPLYGLLLLPVWILILILSPIHAFRAIRASNPVEFETQRRSQKDPWLAAWLSIFLPGLGFFYAKFWLAGITALSCTLAFAAANAYLDPYFKPFPSPLDFVLYFSFVYVTFRYVQRLRPSSVAHPVRAILAVILTLYAQQSALVLFRTHVVTPYAITGRSMLPTLEPGDRILVAMQSELVPERGRLIAFLHAETGSTWTARVAAVGGDKVELTPEGELRINDAPSAVAVFQNKTFVPQSPGNDRYWRVPSDCVFVLGDNPERSLDSRSIGPVKLNSVQGTVYKICWPLRRAGPVQ